MTQPQIYAGHAAAFERAAGAEDVPILILCDHASNRIPEGFSHPGLGPDQMERHIAYDIGARGVALRLAEGLRAGLVASRFSRLLIDPNRGTDDPTLIMRISDGAIVPGNAALPDEEAMRRQHLLYDAYHGAVTAELNGIAARGLVPVILSIHSFTPVWRGMPRPWHAAILWDRDPRLALPLIEELRRDESLCIGDNRPYSGRLKGDCLYRHGTMRGFPHALVEIRQDLIADKPGQHEWADRIASAVSRILADPSHTRVLSQVAFFGSHTDLIEHVAPADGGEE